MADNEIEINIQEQSNNISVTPKTQQPDLGLNIDYDPILWGTITGDINNQGDLKAALDEKANTADLATVATTGSYNDLSDKPTTPAAQIQADWNQSDNTKADYIKNKPAIPDISGKANLSGGNSFSGEQYVYKGEDYPYAFSFSTNEYGKVGFTIGANGVKIVAPASLGNIDINNRTVFKNIAPLGNISGTTQSLSAFAVEGCYTATLNGSATIKLPTPTSTQSTKENTINILLNVSGDSNIIWQDTNSNGINANVAMTTFATGKYLIKLRYDNISSQWIGEVLKGEDTVNPVKLFISGNGNIADSSNNPITVKVYNDGTAVYDTGKFADTQAFESKKVNTFYKYGVLSGNNLSKLNLGAGDFTISFWSKNNGQAVSALYKDSGNYISNQYFIINSTNILGSYFSNESDWVYITYTRSGNTLYAFKNGNKLITASYSGNIDLSDFTYLNYNTSSSSSTLLQDLVVKNTCDYTANFTPPTAPYSISDSSLSDYHDTYLIEEINKLKGAIMRRMDFANAVAVNIDNSADTYTVPSNGYLQLNYLTSAAASWEYKLNSKSVYISNVELMPVSKDDILGIDSTEFTGLFIPEKTN